MADASSNKLDLAASSSWDELAYQPRHYRRSWTRQELIALFPGEGISILDLGAGDNPLKVRPIDRPATVDFAVGSGAEVIADVATSWPFAEEEFHLVYISHVVGHFYPQDRHVVVRHVHRSVREGGLVFIRVPHKSHTQGTGWKHFSELDLNGVVSPTHGRNHSLLHSAMSRLGW